jgi:hypothetical protein
MHTLLLFPATTFEYTSYAHGAKHKTMRLKLKEFVRRFCLHFLPGRFVKIRHFGFLSNRQRRRTVAQARALLAPPQSPPSPAEQPAAPLPPAPPLLCPFCGSARLRVVQVVLPSRRTPVPLLDSS